MDRTEFKKRMLSLKSYRENNPGKGYWDWKVELFEEGGILLPEIEVLGTYPRKQHVYDRANSSLANFIQRAKDINRNTIPDWEIHNAVATHKLSYAEDGGKYVVYPDVLEINGNLYDFTDPKNGHYRNRKYRWTDALDSAINRGDTLTFDRESDAKYFTEHYKEYYPSFEEGGEVPPSDYRGSNEPARVNPITGKPLANGVVYTTIPPTLGDTEEPSAAIETALSFIPYVGDVMSVRDAYIAAKNKDLLGLGLAGLGLIPFVPRIGRSRVKPDRPPIPTVNKDAIQRLIDLSVSQTDKNKRVLDNFYDLRNRVYESLIENEDAFRRAARADRRSGTSYMLTYLNMVREYGRDGSNLNPNLAQPGYDRGLYEQPIKAQVSTSNPDLIRLNPRYKDPEELDETFLSLNPGLIRHEMGHSTDIKSGLGYTKSLADPSKFEPESKIKEMYPKSYKTILDYLLNGSEIKSHMNEFRDFLFNKGEYLPKETINSIRKKLDKYGSQFKNLNILFDLYKNKRLFVNDYNLIPITATENNDNLV